MQLLVPLAKSQLALDFNAEHPRGAGGQFTLKGEGRAPAANGGETIPAGTRQHAERIAEAVHQLYGHRPELVRREGVWHVKNTGITDKEEVNDLLLLLRSKEDKKRPWLAYKGLRKPAPGQLGLFDEESHPRLGAGHAQTGYKPGEFVPKSKAEEVKEEAEEVAEEPTDSPEAIAAERRQAVKDKAQGTLTTAEYGAKLSELVKREARLKAGGGEVKQAEDPLQAAYRLGQEAHANGITSIPMMDPALMEMLNGSLVGESAPFMKKWTEGWHAANLAQREAEEQAPKREPAPKEEAQEPEKQEADPKAVARMNALMAKAHAMLGAGVVTDQLARAQAQIRQAMEQVSQQAHEATLRDMKRLNKKYVPGHPEFEKLYAVSYPANLSLWLMSARNSVHARKEDLERGAPAANQFMSRLGRLATELRAERKQAPGTTEAELAGEMIGKLDRAVEHAGSAIPNYLSELEGLRGAIDDAREKLTAWSSAAAEGKEVTALRAAAQEALRGLGVPMPEEARQAAEKKEARVGGRSVPDFLPPSKLEQQFGLKSVVAAKSTSDRAMQHHLKGFYAAMADLADMLGLDDKDLGFRGNLTLSIGADTKASRAGAHYNPNSRLMNVGLKESSAAVAHEWFHALDHALGRQHAPSGSSTKFASVYPSKLPEGTVKEALRGVMETIKGSEYLKHATRLGFQRGARRGYWDNNQELMARAFEGYVHDKMKAAGRHNPYLVDTERDTVKNSRASTGLELYPQGAERAQINAAFDQLMAALRDHKELLKALRGVKPAPGQLSLEFDPDEHPRAPAGSDRGGQFVKKAEAQAGGDLENPKEHPGHTRAPLPQVQPEDIAHKWRALREAWDSGKLGTNEYGNLLAELVGSATTSDALGKLDAEDAADRKAREEGRLEFLGLQSNLRATSKKRVGIIDDLETAMGDKLRASGLVPSLNRPLTAADRRSLSDFLVSGGAPNTQGRDFDDTHKVWEKVNEGEVPGLEAAVLATDSQRVRRWMRSQGLTLTWGLPPTDTQAQQPKAQGEKEKKGIFGGGAMTYEQAVTANMQHMGTGPTEWKAVGIGGFQEVTDDRGKSKDMPVFEFPSGYTAAPSMFHGEGCCGLCGTRIKDYYWLQHDGKRWTLGVGSECVTRFEAGDSGKRLSQKAKWEMNRQFLDDAIQAKRQLYNAFTEKTHVGYGRYSYRFGRNKGAERLYRELEQLTKNMTAFKGDFDRYPSTDAVVTRWEKKNGDQARNVLEEATQMLVRHEEANGEGDTLTKSVFTPEEVDDYKEELKKALWEGDEVRSAV